VIVVEGRDDTRRLKEVFPDIETFETGGSAVDSTKLEQIKLLHEKRGVIVFTDPDFPGQKIRQTIMDSIPSVRHAYLSRSDAIRKKGRGLGVEHASSESIKSALESAMTPSKIKSTSFNPNFLIQYGLTGSSDSKKRREFLSSSLGIGYVNGKQLKNRLKMFGIDENRVIEVLSSYSD